MPEHVRRGVVIVPFSGTAGACLKALARHAAGRLGLGMQEKADWVVSHSALPSRAWWVTSAAFFYNKPYKEPRHE